MGITSYCKKCGQDVPRGEVCANCGARLTKNSARVVWCLEHSPVRDWMCWNGVLRIMAPSAAGALLLALLLEGVAGGLASVERLLSQGLLVTWGTLCLAALALLWLILLLQGHDLLDCVVDSKGVHVTTYLLNPTPLRLLMRMQSPAMCSQAVPAPQGSILLLRTREVTWQEISRVQLWPEKATILLYAPSWWMRLALPCSAFQYEAVLEFMRDKVGRRKDLLLPPDIKAPPKPRKPRASSKRAAASEEPAPPIEMPSMEEMPLAPEEAEAMRDLLAEMHDAAPLQQAEDVTDM